MDEDAQPITEPQKPSHAWTTTDPSPATFIPPHLAPLPGLAVGRATQLSPVPQQLMCGGAGKEGSWARLPAGHASAPGNRGAGDRPLPGPSAATARFPGPV